MLDDEEEDVKTEIFDTDERNVYIGASSVIGKRKEQQDYYLADNCYAYMENNRVIGVLCDGMGGLSGGEQASSLCASIVFNTFHNLAAEMPIPTFFRSMIARADREVSALRAKDGSLLKAGTTMVSAVIDGSSLYWASVGDSRIYIIRGQQILCITQDHNLMMLLRERVKRGEITQAEADSNPKKEALISYIGSGMIRYIDINSKPLQLVDGDHIILCSDGLYRSVTESEMLKIVTEYKDGSSVAAQMLTDLAISKGKPHQDNTTVVVMNYHDPG